MPAVKDELMEILEKLDLLRTPFADFFAALRRLTFDAKLTNYMLFALGYKNANIEQPEDHEMMDNFLIFALAKEYYKKMV